MIININILGFIIKIKILNNYNYYIIVNIYRYYIYYEFRKIKKINKFLDLNNFLVNLVITIYLI